jgi:signal transduction histidine kinase
MSELTGVRSGKRSYYREFRRSSQRLQAAVEALDEISLTLVHTAEGPRALLAAVLHAAGQQLGAQWVVFAIADGALPSARPRVIAAQGDGNVLDDAELSPAALAAVETLRADPPRLSGVSGDGVVLVPMSIDGEPMGGIAAGPGLGEDLEALDLAVVRILVNQAAVALHTSFLYHSSLALQSLAEQLSQEATQNAHDLALRNQELHSAQELLVAARQRELLDGERHRIARELHDSVTQHVLSAGMMIEVCGAETERLGREHADLTRRLAQARGMTRLAVSELRSAIYALHHAGDQNSPLLPRLLEQACRLRQHPGLAIDLRLEGSPVLLPVSAEESMARLAGEALFNVSVHSKARRCVVRLSYRPSELLLTVDDDGIGDPAALRSTLRVGQAGDVDGGRRGLVNMCSRAAEAGGTFALRRSRLGGVRMEVRIPLPVTSPGLQGPP